jgi:diguanylate cyclase (GGDEF)-like protein/PAS domain S-box-containing protein
MIDDTEECGPIRAEDARKLFEMSLDLLCIAGTDGYFKHVNPAFHRTLGWNRKELLSQPFLDLVHPEDVESTEREIARLNAGTVTYSFTNLYRTSDGGYRELRWSAWPDREAGLFYCVARDETELLAARRELEDANRRLAELASTDSLKSISNRRSFMERFDTQIRLAKRRGQNISLLMLDVDCFKDFNDRFGHPAGDVVLADVAKILAARLRDSDLICRFGGEEFAVVLQETDIEGALHIAESLRTAVENHLWQHREITISVGASTLAFNQHYEGGIRQAMNTLIQRSDEALYESKRGGRNRIAQWSGA